MTQAQNILLELLPRALWGTSAPDAVPAEHLPEIIAEAKAQGVLPLMLVGAFSSMRGEISGELRNEWRTVLHSTAISNDLKMIAQDSLVKLLDTEEIPYVVLKGSSLSVYYQQPDLRPLGDIDLLICRKDQEKVQNLLQKQGFSLEPADHPYHITLYKGSTVVEVHHAMTRPHTSPGGIMANAQMELFSRHIQRKSLANYTFPVLEDPHQALSLLLHMESHMTFGGLGLRQICDWAAFVDSVPLDVFTDEILPLLNKCGLTRFAQVVTKSCTMYLGLNSSRVPWCVDVPETLSSRLMEEILRTGNMGRALECTDLSYMAKSTQGEKSPLSALANNLWTLIKRNYPAMEKYPFLFPLFLVHRIILFLLRQWRKKQLIPTLKTSLSSHSRETLYRQMHLFEPEPTHSHTRQKL